MSASSGPGVGAANRHRDGLATFLETAPDAMVVVDDAGQIVLLNTQAEVLFGYPQGELLGNPIELLVPERFRASHPASRHAFGVQPMVRPMGGGRELFARRKDGTEFPVEISLSPMESNGERLVTAAIRDVTERKRIERELDRALRERRNMMETIPDVLYALDREGRLVQWNRNLMEVTGYTPQELMNRPAVSFFPEGEHEKIVRAIEQAFQEGYAQVEGHLLSRDGRTTLHHFTSVPLHDDEGNVIGLTGAGRDVTDRHEAERRLEESEQRYRSLSEHNPDAVYSFDLDGNFRDVNPAVEALTGYAKEDLMGRSFEPLVAPEDLDRVVERFQEAAKGSAQRYQATVIHRDGGRVLVDVTNIPIIVEGEVVGVFGIAKDVTDQHEQEKRFRSLLEAAPDAMVIADASGFIVLVNSQTENLFGYDRKELIGKPVEVLMPGRFRHAHVQHREGYAGAPRTRPMGMGLDLYARRKDGTEFPVEISLSPLETEDGMLVTAAVRDITERKTSEARLRASLREKDVLLKEIHHRVKNNLQIIVSLLNLQSGSTGDAVSYEVLAESRNRVKSMALVHEALYRSPDLSSIDFGAYVEHLSRELCRSYGTDLERVRLDVDVAHVQLAVDPALQLALVLNELLSNSLKHAFPEDRSGSIHVRFHGRDAGVVVLEVRDDGVGLPSGVTPETARTLGLQLVSTIATQLGGRLEMFPGPGSGFRVTLEGGGQNA